MVFCSAAVARMHVAGDGWEGEGYCECGEMDPRCSAGRLPVTILPKVL